MPIDPYNFPKTLEIEGVTFNVILGEIRIEPPAMQELSVFGGVVNAFARGSGRMILKLELMCPIGEIKRVSPGETEETKPFIAAVRRKFNIE